MHTTLLEATICNFSRSPFVSQPMTKEPKGCDEKSFFFSMEFEPREINTTCTARRFLKLFLNF